MIIYFMPTKCDKCQYDCEDRIWTYSFDETYTVKDINPTQHRDDAPVVTVVFKVPDVHVCANPDEVSKTIIKLLGNKTNNINRDFESLMKDIIIEDSHGVSVPYKVVIVNPSDILRRLAFVEYKVDYRR